jgi:hypothetical protein
VAGLATWQSSGRNEKSRQYSLSAFFFMLVGVQGFEPWTPWSQTRCATGLRYTPKTKIIALQQVQVKFLGKNM